MRWWPAWILFIVAGCGNTSATAPVYDLTLHAELAPLTPSGEVAISTARLFLSGVTAVSDRSSSDARARVASIALTPGDATDQDLPSAPPGLYSAVALMLGDASTPGLDVQAVWNEKPVHATLAGGPYAIACADPVALALGSRARLALSADPARWFDGVDLSGVTSDADDNGIVLSEDDNQPQANLLLINVVASLKLDCGSN